jgi:hypothetical protein
MKVVNVGTLLSGRSASCGCLNAELASARRRKHGMSKSRTYAIWLGMKARCLDQKNEAFHNYGGRGIQVCERWLDFSNFLADMGEAPAGLSIERKENDKHYEKDNCKWATPTEQANNRRSNRVFAVNGESLNIGQLAKKYNVPYWRLRARLLILKWPPEKAVSL